MTPEQTKLFAKMICDSIVESVSVAGKIGAPAGHLYAALMVYGFSLDNFNTIMGTLVRAGRLTQRGDLYFANDDASLRLAARKMWV